MAYTKKTWVDVPNPSNPPSIPEGQDALARFDAANMNRIEEGIDAAKTHIENESLHNRAKDGGGALGNNSSTMGGAGAVGSGASAESGGAVGNGAKAISGGAIGYQAQTTSGGGSAGYMANTLSGGAVGSGAKSTNGGAVGNGARAGSGAAIGLGAQTVDESGAEIDAIQLGTGKNTIPKTLQAYNYQLMKADGTIPVERIPSVIAKIATGSYEGNGLDKNGTRIILTADFEIELVIIAWGETNAKNGSCFFMKDIPIGMDITGDIIVPNIVVFQGNTISFGHSNSIGAGAKSILNESGVTYKYIMFGKGR